jgi:hypothetical protein
VWVTARRYVWRLAAALMACLLVVLLGPHATALASHPPSPAPSGVPAEVSSWSCHTTTTTTVSGSTAEQECAATGWAQMPAYPEYSPPAVQDVRLAEPVPPVQLAPADVQPTLAVREAAPQSTTLTCGDGTTACAMEATVTESQWVGLSLLLGGLLLLAVVSFFRREGRSIRG